MPRLYKHLPYFALSLAYYLLRMSLFSRPLGTLPSFSGYLTQTKALVFYHLKLALLPFGLNVDRDFPGSDSLLISDR